MDWDREHGSTQGFRQQPALVRNEKGPAEASPLNLVADN